MKLLGTKEVEHTRRDPKTKKLVRYQVREWWIEDNETAAENQLIAAGVADDPFVLRYYEIDETTDPPSLSAFEP